VTDIGREFVFATVILVATMVCVVALHLVVLPRVRRLLRRDESTLDESVVDGLVGPTYAAIALAGVYTASMRLSILEDRLSVIDRWATIGFVVIGFVALLRVLNALVSRYVQADAEGPRRDRLPDIGALRKVVNLALLVLLVTIVLGQFGVKITPLLTSLGIAGVAMALALQDTLANLFAGFYLLFDRPLRVGDYVKLENGDEGFVTDIGWRNTKIRPWANNVVIIPNSRLAGSIVVNHHLPEERQNVYVACGVGYDSDLEHVERVCVQVGREVMARVEGPTPNGNRSSASRSSANPTSTSALSCASGSSGFSTC